MSRIGTYGHSQLKTGHPVRFAIHKQLNGRLVLRWVTTWESLLMYVLESLLLIAKTITFVIWHRKRETALLFDSQKRDPRQVIDEIGKGSSR
ncbi:hypothetical protein KCU78_g4256, partial [Aureobasidium melanogenum]